MRDGGIVGETGSGGDESVDAQVSMYLHVAFRCTTPNMTYFSP